MRDVPQVQGQVCKFMGNSIGAGDLAGCSSLLTRGPPFAGTRGLGCVYLADHAETQVQALKRKHDESQHENHIYRELYRLLVTVGEPEALDILQRLRAGTDVETTIRHVQEGDLLLQLALRPESRFRYQFPYLPFMPAALQTSDNPYLESLLYEGAAQGFTQSPSQHQQPSSAAEAVRAWSNSHVYMKPYHAAELVDGRLASAKAADWTAVTTDDNLFRRLLRAYLVHEYCVAPAFQKDYFLYDLARGKGQLCSSLLVNSVMAIASVCISDTINAFRSELWNPQNIGYRFLVEARRLWELEDLENPRLTTFQATILLSLAYNSHGMGYYFMRRAWLSEPPEVSLPDPDKNPAWYGEFALVYPPSTAPTPMHWPHTFRAMCGLRVIMNRVAYEAFRDHHPHVVAGLPRDTALEIQSRLREWYAGLPGPLEPKTAVFPSHLRLHLEYFSIHLTLATTVIEEEAEIHSSEDLEPSSDDEDDGAPPPVTRTGPTAMRNLETVARLYYMRHGFEACDSSLAYFLALLASISLRALKGGGDGARFAAGRGWPEVLRSTLILAMKGLHDQGRHLHVCKVLFRLLRDRMHAAEADILGRFVISSGEGGGGGGDGGGEGEGGGSEANLALHTRSRFPLPMVKMGEDLNAAILENLVEKYQAVSLQSSDSTGSGDGEEDITAA
ncbi:hypothetical protein SLS64_012891 [Diaporthe eres]